MKKQRQFLTIFVLLAILFLYGTPRQALPQTSLKPLTIPDMLEWKSIQNAVISKDGRWFAYILAPTEGDREAVIRSTQDTTEYQFQIGGRGGKIAFSDDSKWVAFTVSPADKKIKSLTKHKKKIYNKVMLLNLQTGDTKTFEKVRRFSFDGENSNWLALQKDPPEGGTKKSSNEGSDLLLYNLKTDEQLAIGNVGTYEFNKKGNWLVWSVDAEDKSLNGVQIRNMTTGVVRSLDHDEAVYRSLNWNEKGTALALLKNKDPEKKEDQRYCVIGYKNFKRTLPEKYVYDPEEDAQFPKGMTISPNRTPTWTDDLRALVFGIHRIQIEEKANEQDSSKEEIKKSKGKAKAGEEDEEKLPDMVIWHWKDKRLQSMQQVQEKRDKNYSYLSLYFVESKKFVRLADDDLRDVRLTPRQRFAIGLDNREYELQGNLDGRRYRDIYVINPETGERKLVLKKIRWYFSPSTDGTHFLYYRDGHFFTYDMRERKSYNITANLPVSFIDTEDDHNVKNPPIRPVGWSSDGKYVLLSDNWDIWKVPVHGGKGVNLTQFGRRDSIRFRRPFRLDPEEKGIDLNKPLYFSIYGEWTKKGGIALVNGKKGGAKKLLWDDAVFSRLIKAKDADVYLYTRETYKDFPNYYVTDGSLLNGRQLTDANPQQKEFAWSDGVRLIEYKGVNGKRLQAALFLPATYEEGKSYPTIVYIYEKLSQNLNRYFFPSVRGFNKSFYTSNGYAVLMPDIVYKVNDPGRSAVACVLPAIEEAVRTGIVDRNRVGLHGHSWGGYQTAFLVTQTDLFKAAVAGAPLTNLISMYSSIYWNTGSANQPIFESSQGRFTGGYWENLEAYTRNSPVYYAQNVQTPLIILHNDRDGAVDWNQGIEYFNTLRRLGKPVVMLQYKGENHGLRKPENQKDYTVRMQEFFDHYLKDKPAPGWWKEGVPYLKIEEHLKERQKLLKRPESDKSAEPAARQKK